MEPDTDRLRVVCLFGTGIIFDKTLSILLQNNVNVVGVCNANKHTGGKVDFSYLKIAAKKYGYGTLFSQILGRGLYKVLNHKKDREIFNKIYNPEEIAKATTGAHYETHATSDYGSPETIEWLKKMRPDIFVVHTGYWVGKKVRDIVQAKCIGGHPGITPQYRGVHSPFWAAFRDDWDNIGYTVFWVDSGIDTGAIIYQGKIQPEKGDSFFTMSWKGMVKIAEVQASIINKMDKGEMPVTKKVGPVSEETNYTHPTLRQYLSYMFKQKRMR